MNDTELIERLIAAITQHVKPTIPLSVDIWDTAYIAAYMKLSKARVLSDVVCQPTFPKPKHPIPGGRARYVAREVIAWTESQES